VTKKSRLKSEPDLTAKFAKALRQGDTIADTCIRLEVPLSSYKDWMRWGTRSEGEKVVALEPYKTFAREVSAALAGYKGALLDEIGRQGRDARYANDVLDDEGNVLHKRGDIILNPKGYVARPGHWNANAWLLQVRFPKEFAPQVRVIVEEQLNAALRALERELEPEVYARVLDIIARSGESPGEQGSDLGGAGAPPAGGAPAAAGAGPVTRH
jgi:hypothetical protein